MAKPIVKKIDISGINTDDANYPRAKVNEDVVEEYARIMKAGVELPPLVVFSESRKYYLADGRHRLEAQRRIGSKTIQAEVRKGGRRDALLYAVGANAKHGLRRSTADRRKAVELLLDDPEWREWSTNQIAKVCNVSWEFAERVAKEYLPDRGDDERVVRRGDSTYRQKVGKRRKKEATPRTPVRAMTEMLSLLDEARLLATQSGKKTSLTKELPNLAERLESLIGKETGAKRLKNDLPLPLNVYHRPRKDGIERSPEFEKKGLATHAVNVGLGCGHGCRYCSSPSLRRAHEEFQRLELNAYTTGIAIIDPNTPERIKKEIPSLTKEDVIQLCTLDDAWSPEARALDLGRKCLEVLLEQTPAQVRILTKSHLVEKEFDFVHKYKERVIVGLSTGIPKSHEDIAAIIEPNASAISKRLATLKKAHTKGLRTFGMLCPVLPGIGDSRDALEGLFDVVIDCGVETIWLEPVNARGPGLKKCSESLRLGGFANEALAMDHIRKEKNWSSYATALIKEAIAVAKKKDVLDKLKILLYPKRLLQEHRAELKKLKRGIVWLEESTDKEKQSTG